MRRIWDFSPSRVLESIDTAEYDSRNWYLSGMYFTAASDWEFPHREEPYTAADIYQIRTASRTARTFRRPR